MTCKEVIVELRALPARSGIHNQSVAAMQRTAAYLYAVADVHRLLRCSIWHWSCQVMARTGYPGALASTGAAPLMHTSDQG